MSWNFQYGLLDLAEQLLVQALELGDTAIAAGIDVLYGRGVNSLLKGCVVLEVPDTLIISPSIML